MYTVVTKVTVEATLEHPFFVFGRGWSSGYPTKTFQRYGLECHQLAVGDVCISLVQNDSNHDSHPPADSSGDAPGVTEAIRDSRSKDDVNGREEDTTTPRSSSSPSLSPSDIVKCHSGPTPGEANCDKTVEVVCIDKLKKYASKELKTRVCEISKDSLSNCRTVKMNEEIGRNSKASRRALNFDLVGTVVASPVKVTGQEVTSLSIKSATKDQDQDHDMTDKEEEEEEVGEGEYPQLVTKTRRFQKHFSHEGNHRNSTSMYPRQRDAVRDAGQRKRRWSAPPEPCVE